MKRLLVLMTFATALTAAEHPGAEWADVAQTINMRSARKSLLSGPSGIHVAEGHIELGKTVGERGIDHNEPAK